MTITIYERETNKVYLTIKNCFRVAGRDGSYCIHTVKSSHVVDMNKYYLVVD